MKFVDWYTRKTILDIIGGLVVPEKVTDDIIVFKNGDVTVGKKSMTIYGVVFEGKDVIKDLGEVNEIIKLIWERWGNVK